jgi:hypothetical protein
MYADDVQLYLSGSPCDLDECIRRMNADLGRLYDWSTENGLCLNPGKSQAIVIGFPGFCAAAFEPVSMGCGTIPFCTKVKSLGLIINSRFAWDDQINIVCRRVYFTLKRLWTTASLTPVRTRLQLARSLVVPMFLYCDVIFSKVALGLRDKLRLAYNSCARYVFGIRRSEHISGYSFRILGLPLAKYYSFRICCQMYKIVSTQKPDYLFRELQFGRSARLTNLIIRRHHFSATASSFFVRGAVLWNCLPVSVRGESSEGRFRSRCRAFVEETAIAEFC